MVLPIPFPQIQRDSVNPLANAETRMGWTDSSIEVV